MSLVERLRQLALKANFPTTIDDLHEAVDLLQSQERTIAELRAENAALVHDLERVMARENTYLNALERIATMADCEHPQRFARKALGDSHETELR